MVSEFDDIRPYYDSEINDAMVRIISNPVFDRIADFLYPGVSIEAIKNKFRSVDSVYSFQINVMDAAIRNILKMTSSGLYYSGMDNLSSFKRYLFLSNYRDILLDATILQVVLNFSNYETSEISFGDNLMSSELVVDIGKANKMFRLNYLIQKYMRITDCGIPII